MMARKPAQTAKLAIETVPVDSLSPVYHADMLRELGLTVEPE
jgi:hypothetical protein